MSAPFISRTDLGNYLGQELTSDDHALACVDASCEAVRTIAEQSFNLVEDDVATLDGSGTDALLIPELPVTELVSVEGWDSSTDSWSDEEDYALTVDGILVKTNKGIWTKGRQNFAVTYSHGYADQDLPRDVRMCALSMAARIFMQGVAGSESIGSVSVKYAVASTDFTVGEKAILRKYKRTK